MLSSETNIKANVTNALKLLDPVLDAAINIEAGRFNKQMQLLDLRCLLEKRSKKSGFEHA